METHACESCRFCVVAARAGAHDSILQAYAQLADPLGIQRRLYEQGYQRDLAAEAGEAIRTGGHLAEKPLYVSYCRKYSSRGRYAVCGVINRHGGCRAWERGTPAEDPGAGALRTETARMIHEGVQQTLKIVRGERP